MNVCTGQLYLVRCGAEDRKATQIALVVARSGAALRIRRWKDASKEWSQPSSVELDKIVGTVPVSDRRRGIAQRALTKEILESVQWTGRQAT